LLSGKVLAHHTQGPGFHPQQEKTKLYLKVVQASFQKHEEI
jgi:hypothetical protein